MNSVLVQKLKESLISVLPISIVIVILNFTLPNPMTSVEFTSFIIGAILLIFGMMLYSLGSDTALAPIGESIGNSITSTKKVPIILTVGFIIGVIVTIAEPDLMVLGSQLGEIKNFIIIAIAIGVGLFLVLALSRILSNVNLNVVLIIVYAIIFLLAILVDNQYIGLSFDSGGVTTGPITVPFIMALGVGVAGSLGGKNKTDNSFGVVAICSAGPILLVLLACFIFKPDINVTVSAKTITSLNEIVPFVFKHLLVSMKDVAIAILPIGAFFIIMNFVSIKTPKQRFVRILIGLVYTYIGLSLFLTGVNVGFMSTGYSLGERLALLDNKMILVIVAMIIGCFMVLAEPAVHVLSKQVETISDGIIKRSTILIALSISMIIAVGLSMLRIVMNISIWYILLPGYALAIILSFFVPKIYTAIAFDSGGVASGPMATTFTLPLAIGAATCLTGSESVLFNAYGLISFIALTPLITIQLIGVIVRIKQGRRIILPKAFITLFEGDIIELDLKR